MATPLRLGVVGAGAFSQNRMLPNFVNLEGIDVLAVGNMECLEAAYYAATEGRRVTLG